MARGPYSPTIFNGDFVKTLKDSLKLGENVKILTGDSDDPTSVAKDAPIGSLYFRDTTAEIYKKEDAGSSTNWILLPDLNINEDSKEPTGFVNKTDSSLSFVDGTRTFTIQPAVSSYDYYIHGIKYTKTGADNVVISNTEGLHYIYFDGSTLSSTTTFSDDLYYDYAIIAILYWDATNLTEIGGIAEERHGITMDGSTHEWLHDFQGTQYESGLALGDITADGDGSSNTHTTCSVGNGVIHDEDNVITITDGSPQTLSSIAQIPVYYKDGAAGNWRVQTANDYPVITFSGGSSLLAWNEFTGGSWQQTEITSGRYVLAHIFATPSLTNPVISIQGEAEYISLLAVREGASTEINSLISTGLPLEEFKALGSIIYQTSSSYSNTKKARIRTTDLGADYVDFRLSVASSAVSVADHGVLTGLEQDDHAQYALLDGRSTGQNLYLGTSTSSDSCDVNGVTVTPTLIDQTNGAATEVNHVSLRNNDTAGVGARHLMKRSRGSKGSETIVVDGDIIACIDSAGYDGTDYAVATEIAMLVDGTPGSNDMPGKISLRTSPDGTQVPVEGLSIDSSQQVSLKSGVAVDDIKDEDDMTSDSATALCTQQSIKAYVDDAVDLPHLEYICTVGTTYGTGANTRPNYNSGVETDSTNFTVTTGASWQCAVTNAGLYTIEATMHFTANATGVRIMNMYKNAAVLIERDSKAGFSGSDNTLRISRTVRLAASDYVYFDIFHNAGVNLFQTAPNDGTKFTITRIGD